MYRFSPNYSIQISLENGHLWVRDTGDKALELAAENNTEFFSRTIDAQVSFVTDGSGKAVKLVLHINGDDSVGVRVQ